MAINCKNWSIVNPVVWEVEDNWTLQIYNFRGNRQSLHSDSSLSKVVSINHTIKYVLFTLCKLFHPLAMCCNGWFITISFYLTQWEIYCSSVLCILILSSMMYEAPRVWEESSALHFIPFDVSYWKTKRISMKMNYSSLRNHALISP